MLPLGLLVAIAIPAIAQSPPVKISLRTSWPSPPPLVELLETIALESPDSFFPFLDQVTKPESFAHVQNASPEALHQYVLQLATSHGYLSDPGAVASVEMNMALHAATPKIEAFYQHYTHFASKGSACESWVDWYGTVVCDIETLVHLAGIETLDPSTKNENTSSYTRPQLLSFDHIYPPPSQIIQTPPRTAVLYASISSPNFRALFSYLMELAQRPIPHVEFVLRHVPITTTDASPRSTLSGYGVALDLKKTDYLAVDDRFMKKKGSANNGQNGDTPVVEDPVISLLDTFDLKDTSITPETPLTTEEIRELGHQATQLILSASSPLSLLKQLSQNFPKYVTSLARRVTVNPNVSEEIHAKQLKVQGGVNAVWLNGNPVSPEDMNPFKLLKLLRKEREIMLSLTSLGLSRGIAMDLLSHPAIAASHADTGALDGIFDASDRIEGGEVIVWWNDMTKDLRYEAWQPSLSALLRRLYPGQFPSLKMNLFNIVLVLDLSHAPSLGFVTGPVSSIIERGFPFRFGVVPIIETGDSMKMARLFYYMVESYGRKKTMTFLKRVAPPETVPSNPRVQWDVVETEFAAFTAEEEWTTETPKSELGDILAGKVTSKVSFDNVTSYSKRLGTSLVSSPLGHTFVNGKHFNMGESFLRNMQMESGNQIQHLQEQIYSGKLSDDDVGKMGTYFYDLPSSSSRRNRHIVPATGGLRVFNLPQLFKETGFVTPPNAFIYPSKFRTGEQVVSTMYVIADLDSNDGLDLVKEAIDFVNIESAKTRISLIHNGKTGKASQRLTSLVLTNAKLTPVSVLSALGDEDAPGGEQAPLTAGEDVKTTPAEDKYSKSTKLLLRAIGIPAGQSALLINGRAVGPLAAGDFLAADLKALEAYELRKRVEPVRSALESDFAILNDVDTTVSMASSIIASMQLPDPEEVASGMFDPAAIRPRQRVYRMLDGKHTTFEFGDNSTALYELAVLVDPLTETAQKWASILEWAASMPDMFIEVHLNPANHGEIPLKKFFRYNLLSSPTFDESGQEREAQTIFEGLPIEPIYTLAMDVPHSWLVRPRISSYDLDNIQLPHDEQDSVEAIFALDYLVVEGHARDTLTNAPPRGVQIELVDSHGKVVDDTQVVANLGYFQFKATPGIFTLRIRPGRGTDVFDMEMGSDITLTSFDGLVLYPGFKRRPGMEEEDVLAEPSSKADHGLFDDIKSGVLGWFGAGNAQNELAKTSDNGEAEINIFTVASGLLYERFASIMILSVLRNTNSTVKFWFIENFLSPSFLEFIPHMAAQYNFSYELVTYKWPSWLRAQTEKQRIIWGYKILFLDVLFPMSLKRVIFVDADQIVRADLKELVDLDMEGRAYGYTPMGDDNTDMEGFRFWKTGYWKDFLKGQPYFISALYVIDLVRFRQVAAGDILRGQYQALSADPGSLANLDQDLPNNLQREVPIFQLHEDWLWCETWCSKDRLHRAKTIDLCQNPLTKEPKLSRARQIPEWSEYDNEIAEFARGLTDKGLLKSRGASLDSGILAGGPAVSQGEPEQAKKETSEPVRDEL